ncbi:MAG: hypothetical protein JXA58_03520 [Dehalococcoidia bacterium]|nr:hypothetical protein [Dehalococcoidia bacterium]
MIEMNAVLDALRNERPLFHSEDDFKFALAWKLQEMYPSAVVRLERPHDLEDRRIYVDITVEFTNERLAIELKYKTRRLLVLHNGELFDLKDQSAQDLGRYDFCKDLSRLETIVAASSATVGYAILLTNDSSYWRTANATNTAYAAFSIHDGAVVSGNLMWGATAGPGTTNGRSAPIDLMGSYEMTWDDYVILKGSGVRGTCTAFRYVLCRVENL